MISEFSCMDEIGNGKKRRVFHWPEAAEELVSKFLESTRCGRGGNKHGIAALATRLASLSGNPRDACLRYMHHRGVSQKRFWHPWTKPEQQRLLELRETCTVEEMARALQRSPASVRSMLHRLGESSQRGREWFTPYTLAEALHIRADEVQKWIAKGWLHCRVIETSGLTKRIIEPDDFSAFVKQYGPTVVGRRLKPEGLTFVQSFVFPPKHAHLLPLRKREEMSVAEQDDRDPEKTALDDIA